MTASVIALWPLVALTVALGSSGQQAPRDRARPLTGTGSISGTILTDETGAAPLARATMTLWIAGDTLSRRSVVSDEAGRFAFVDLPAGAYTLTGAKPAYVTTYFGARRVGSAVGVPIALAEGQRLGSITLRMPRGGVITGTIAEENGRPVQGVIARLYRVTAGIDGAKTFTPYAPGPINNATTDDRGIYRIFGVPPGDYVVSARPAMPGDRVLLPPTGAGGQMETRQTTMAEVQWADRLLAGTAATAGAPGVVSAPERGVPIAFANVYHPNVVDASAAVSVSVGTGQERAGVDLRVRYVATSRVEGSVVDPSGQPTSAVLLMLVPKNDGPVQDTNVARSQELISAGLMASPGSTRPNADGSFAIAGVEPGRYWLTARTTTRPVPLPGEVPAPMLWGSVDLDVEGRDIRGVMVTLSPGVTMTGKVTFAGTKAAPPSTRIGLQLQPMHPSSVAINLNMPASPEGPFEVPGIVPGRYRLNATGGGGWLLQSVTVGGRDVTDATFEIAPGQPKVDVVLTMTDALASLSGTLLDASNRPSSDLAIILFSTDRSMWSSGSRRLRQPVRPDSSGRFAFTAIPGGDYFLAALTDYEPSDWFNPAFLDQVAAGAIKVAIGQRENKTQDVRIAR